MNDAALLTLMRVSLALADRAIQKLEDRAEYDSRWMRRCA